jgi:hypothetical protein
MAGGGVHGDAAGGGGGGRLQTKQTEVGDKGCNTPGVTITKT